MKVTTRKQIETLELYSNNQNEKFTREVQQQIWAGRIKELDNLRIDQ